MRWLTESLVAAFLSFSVTGQLWAAPPRSPASFAVLNGTPGHPETSTEDRSVQTVELAGRLTGQIDALILEASVGPTADVCSDQDFLRRVYLDFCGVIPTAAAAREFLADTSADKRDRLVDELTHAPGFARHMAHVLDVWLLERRADKGIARDEWHEFLFQSIAAGKPFDQLARELLAADGSPGDTRVRAKFLLDRECDPHGLVRDIGRVFLGRDLQCAQCHDHPLVSDYHQDEYYGLLALLQRTYLFTDKQNGNTLLVGERGDGIPEYHSVFLPDQPPRTALPYVAGHVPLELPLPEVGREYVVAPAANVRSIPRFSLRSELATELTVNNPAFDRALANRLWSIVFGRGLVDPVDMHHGDNPPSHPELLDLLANSIRALGYDLRDMLVVLAKTDAYQRSIEPPSAAQIVSARPDLERIRQESAAAVVQRESVLDHLKEEARVAAKTRVEAAAGVRGLLQQTLAVQTQLSQKLDQVAKLREQLASLEQQLAERRSQAQVVAVALEKTQAALAKLTGDPDVQRAFDALSTRSMACQVEVQQLESQHGEVQSQTAQAEQARDQLQALRSAKRAEFAESLPGLQTAHRDWVQRLERRNAGKAQLAQEQRRERFAEKLILLSDQAQSAAEDSSAVDRLYQEALPRWACLFVVSTPRPLSPEQLAFSFWQATGQLPLERRAALQEWLQQHPAPSNLDPTTQVERQSQQEREVRQACSGRLAGAVKQFARLFGGAAGQVQSDFHATADQALFLANGGTLLNLLTPRELNLSARLMPVHDMQPFTEELFLSVLSRHPAEGEAVMVGEYLELRSDKRDAAIRELIWSLLTSAEFRFYR